MTTVHTEQRLVRERLDVHEHFEGAKLLVNRLRGYATEAICMTEAPAKLCPEATCARAIEEIGRQLYGDTDKKRIWQAIRSPDGSEPEGTALDHNEARALLSLAGTKNRELNDGCV